MEVKKMRRNVNQKGKITITTIIVLIVLFYGGFVAFKIITSRLTRAQIKNEIVEKFGFVRGADFTPEKGRGIIEEVLESYGFFVPDEVVKREENRGNTYVDESEVDGVSEEVREGTKIFVEMKERGSKAWFQVEYTDIIDFILFKQKARYTIEEEVINYN
jgi:hypothetical protein